MARRSRADQEIIDQCEALVRRIQKLCGVDKSIKQVLESHPTLMGEALFASALVIALDLKIDDPVLEAFIQTAAE